MSYSSPWQGILSRDWSLLEVNHEALLPCRGLAAACRRRALVAAFSVLVVLGWPCALLRGARRGGLSRWRNENVAVGPVEEPAIHAQFDCVLGSASRRSAMIARVCCRPAIRAAVHAEMRHLGAYEAVRVESVDLGANKTVRIFLPATDRLEFSQKRTASAFFDLALRDADRSDLGSSFRAFSKAGSVTGVLWPSNLPLARLVANCPSFVHGRSVIELGCGLGLVSAAAMSAGPRCLTVSDKDEAVLHLAVQACTVLAKAGRPTSENIARLPPMLRSRLSERGIILESDMRPPTVSQRVVNWFDRATWGEKGSFEVVLASNLLVSAEACRALAEFIAYSLIPTRESGDAEAIVRRALIADPARQSYRDEFVAHAREAGLEVEVVPFPGHADFFLINVIPA